MSRRDWRTRYRWLCAAVAAATWAAFLAGCGGGSSDSGLPVLIFGRTGMGAGEFSYPRAAAIAPSGRLYVVDKAAHVQCFTQDGRFVLDWHLPDKDAGKPTGLGIGPDGTVYVADTHYSRVVVFDPNGQTLGEFGTFGEGPGQFKLPSDVVIDRAGCIYVSEYGGNDRISKFSADRKYLFSFGGPDAGQARLERPQSLLVGPDNTLWVTDACHHRICRFDTEGKLLGEFGRAGQGLGELKFPYGLDMLSDGTLVVTEFGNNRLQRFDTAGQSLGTWGTAGRGPGELASPWTALAGEHDRILLLDSGNNRVQVIDGLARGTWQKPSVTEP
jgi:DNA-binding beta-propeller fold protein YncE